MIEVVYRIYEVADEETAQRNSKLNSDFGLYSSTSQNLNIELVMDCCICDDREHFKSIIRGMYGEKIPFRYSKKLQPGDVYCIIIGEHCWNPERYFNRIELSCDYCNAKVTTYFGKPIAFDEYELSRDLYGVEGYREKRFCSHKCKSDFLKNEVKKIAPGDDDHFWIDKEGFAKLQNESLIGYIYKITKKSTGEFYIGQTMYVPIFRWGEHLHTDRFPLKHITDYQFEVLAEVHQGQNILEVEKEYIQAAYLADPEKSLNISQTQLLRKELNSIDQIHM